MLLAFLGAALGAGLAALLSRGLVAFLTTEQNHMFVGLGNGLARVGLHGGDGDTDVRPVRPRSRSARYAGRAGVGDSRRPDADSPPGARSSACGAHLVVAQVAMSMVLLAGALLFVRSLQNLLAIDPGFRPEGIVAVAVDYRAAHFPKERMTEMRRETLEKLRRRTGAIAAAEVDMTPGRAAGVGTRMHGSPVLAVRVSTSCSTVQAPAISAPWGRPSLQDAISTSMTI